MTDATQHTPDPALSFVGVFDSGIGGLSVTEAMAEYLPAEQFLYVADNARAPYGPQPAGNIIEYSREITRYLLGRGARLIVVACNTATSLAIDTLREEFPTVPFVGLEPAVKPARRGNAVGVMATAATLSSPRYLALKEKYLSNRKVMENPCRGLVPIIEREESGSPALRGKLEEILFPMLAGGIDTLVLGCTHYPMVKDDILAVCGPGVNIIDPSAAAARQVVRMLQEHGLAAPAPSPGAPHKHHRSHELLCTGGSLPLQRSLFVLPGLNAGRKLVVPNAILR